jgi:hypothetical protein
MYELLTFAIENRIQVFSIIGSTALTWIIFSLIKRKKLKEEYSLLWLCFGFIFILLSIFKPLLSIFALTLGIIYAPSALLLILIVSAFFIMIQFSIVISKLSESNKNLIQEVGLLKAQVKQLSKKVQE